MLVNLPVSVIDGNLLETDRPVIILIDRNYHKKEAFLFIFTTNRREWVCSSNCGEAEKQRTGNNYSPRDLETANRLSNESAT